MGLGTFIIVMAFAAAVFAVMDGAAGLAGAVRAEAGFAVTAILTAVVAAGGVAATLILLAAWDAWGVDSLWLLGAAPAALAALMGVRAGR